MQASRTIEAVTRSEFGAVTPADVIKETRALLPPDGVEEGMCRECQEFGSRLKTAATHEISASPANQDEGVIQILSTLLASDTHIGSPTFHANVARVSAWCDIDLWLVKQTILLGIHGVPSTAAWGPGHRVNTTYPDDWTECQACTGWVTARTEARERISTAGSDPILTLGPSDDPSFGHAQFVLRPERQNSVWQEDDRPATRLGQTGRSVV